jgi:hypothetical protein
LREHIQGGDILPCLPRKNAQQQQRFGIMWVGDTCLAVLFGGGAKQAARV